MRKFALAAALVLCPMVAAGAAGQAPAAVVNGVRLEGWELERIVQQRLPMTSFHGRVDAETRQRIEADALDQLITRELKRQRAVETGVTVDAADVEVELAKIRRRFPDAAAYRTALSERGLAEADLRRAVERDLVAERLDEETVEAVPEPTDSEVEAFFAAHRGDYVTPESRHVIHLLVHVPASAPAGAWTEADAEARAVAEAARRGETTLVDGAARRRDALPPSLRDHCGDLGWIHRGALAPVLDEATFAAGPGEVVGPVRSIYGFSVLQTVAVQPPREIELDEVRAAVAASIAQERRNEALARLERELRSRARVETGPWSGGA